MLEFREPESSDQSSNAHDDRLVDKTNLIEYVLGFAFDNNDRVAVILKKRPAWQSGKYNGIGGKIEEGELPRRAMTREFKEETGFLIPPGDWRCFGQLAGKTDGQYWKVFLYAAYNIDLNELKSPTDEKVTIMPCAWIPRYACIDNLKWLVPFAKCHKELDYTVELKR
jgi:8-oxo-dGTP diphosphatase